jgi:predicted PilT family ATPase
MKFVVPNTSAGMVIGKSGARIKEIRDQTNANIQVFPKAGSPEAARSQVRRGTGCPQSAGDQGLLRKLVSYLTVFTIGFQSSVYSKV